MAYITELANDVVLLFINRPKLRAGPLSFLGLGSLQQGFRRDKSYWARRGY